MCIRDSTHPYGYNSNEIDYQNISRDKIVSHYDNYYGSDNSFIFLSGKINDNVRTVSYTHLRAHETVLDLVCRLLLEKKKKKNTAKRLFATIHIHKKRNSTTMQVQLTREVDITALLK